VAASQRPLGCFPLPLALGHTPATAGRLAGQATCQDYGAAGGRSGCAARGFARLPAVDLTSGESQAIRGVGSGRRPPSGFRPPLRFFIFIFNTFFKLFLKLTLFFFKTNIFVRAN